MPSGSGSSGTSGCCTDLYNWGYLDGDYKTKCCNNGTFRKSTTGQSVCCSSEPSNSSLKNNCCNDNSSRSYCTPDCSGQTSSGNPTSVCCAYWKTISWNGVASYTKQACCTGSSGSSWRSSDPDYLSECCGSSPSYSTASIDCCNSWYSKSWSGSSSDIKSGRDKCCSYETFRNNHSGECVLLYPQVQLQVTLAGTSVTLSGPCDSYTGLSSVGNSSDVEVQYTSSSTSYGREKPFTNQTSSISTSTYLTLSGNIGNAYSSNYQLKGITGSTYSHGPAANLGDAVWFGSSCCSSYYTCKTQMHGFTGYPSKYKYRHKDSPNPTCYFPDKTYNGCN